VIRVTADERQTPPTPAGAPICSSCAQRHIREDALRGLLAAVEGRAMKLITAIFAITVALQLTGSLTELVLWWM
jgi:hypothetical protein